MAELQCLLGGLISDDDCRDLGGIAFAAWAKRSDIDWDATAGDDTLWDEETQMLSGFVTTAGNATPFSELEFDLEEGQYTFTKGTDQTFYDINVTLPFLGKSAARTLAIRKAVRCCDIVLVLFGNNGEVRIVGVEWDGRNSRFKRPLRKLRIGEHVDQSNTVNGGRASDNLVFTGRQIDTALNGDFTWDDLPLA